MSGLRSTLVAALAVSILAAAPAAAQRAMTPEDVARLQAVTGARISPDGRTVAYLLSVPRIPFTDEDGPNWAELHVAGADGATRPFVTGEVNVGNVLWTPDGGGIAFTDKRGADEHTAIYEIPLAGGEARRLLAHDESIAGFTFSPDGDRVAFLAREKLPKRQKERKDQGFDVEIFEEQLRPTRIWTAARGEDGELGEPERLPVEGHAANIEWCPGGERLAVPLAPTPLVDDSFTSTRLRVLDPASGEVLAVVETPGKLGTFAWSPDCAHLALVAAADRHDTREGRLLVADASTGEFRDLWPGYEGHFHSLTWRDAETILALGDEGVETVLYATDLAGSFERRIEPGDTVWNVLTSADDGSLAMIGNGASHPGELYLLPAGATTPRRLSDSNPWLAEIALAPQERFTWSARDGLELEGVLIRPLDETAGERYPLILVVHGGPEAHDRDGWRTTYSAPGQVAAGRGFAVLYPNYRGSTGRGVEFARLSQARPAAEEFDDLVDAVDALIEAGLADGDRVGITGGSYGGYATAWAATRYSDRFAAGVMFVGISNKLSKLGTSDIPEEMYLVHERKRLWEDWQHFLEASPIFHVERARTPLLILHGTADTRVDPGQSMELYRHLKTLGQAPVRLVHYPGEPHGNRRAASRYDYSLRMLQWFEHYLQGPGDDKPPPEIDYPLQEEAEAEQDEDEDEER